jgi:hypothetical protein
MLRNVRRNWIYFRVGLTHARYHRNMKRAHRAKADKNIRKFKRYIYRAEDAWRKLVVLTDKQDKLNG